MAIYYTGSREATSWRWRPSTTATAGSVFSVAMHLVGEHAAEEATLDVFTALQNAADYDPARSAQHPLTSIARHRAIDRLRCRDVRPEGHSLSLDGADFILAADNASPEESAAVRMQRQRVHAALSELPEEQRRALALAYLRGLSQREIADELGLPLGTVKTRIPPGDGKTTLLLREEAL